MRHVRLTLSLAAAAVVVGCTSWPHLRNQNGSAAPAPRLAAETPDRATLVAYLNRNASLVKSVECRSLDLDCRQRLQSVGLSGWMVCQKPRNFRMGAKVIGNHESNKYMKDNDKMYLCHLCPFVHGYVAPQARAVKLRRQERRERRRR